MEGCSTILYFFCCFLPAVRLQVDSLERIQHTVFAVIILGANDCSCSGGNIGQVLGIRVVLASVKNIVDAVFHRQVRCTGEKMQRKLEILNIGAYRMARNVPTVMITSSRSRLLLVSRAL